ncbi:MAG: V-type ATPase subunit [Lachnospiraceae bacterium]|jgi:V/A-type H+-transporting ATPase subunit C|nr:V-type ATPase subunit [Lachnospiraceae bacterium]
MNKDYTYAVARIRGRENYLLSGPAMEQLAASKTYDEALHFLADRGWGDPDERLTAENLLAAEEKKTWELIGELEEDLSAFDVFHIADDYHNLKAAIKLAYTGASVESSRLFVNSGTIDPQVISRAIQEKDYSLLPEAMAQKAAEAYDTLLHTGDGQLCDVILDRASLEATYEAGKRAGNEVLKEYAVLTVVAADIKIAVRCGQVGKSLDFITRALAPCEELNIEALAHAALGGVENVAEYLTGTDYAPAAEALKESPAAFERWCDNLIIRHMKPQKSNPFTIGPLAAYILARENEIKCARMVLSGKLNGLPDETIRERLREMYV